VPADFVGKSQRGAAFWKETRCQFWCALLNIST